MSFVRRFSETSDAEVRGILDDLESRARQELDAEGIARADQSVHYEVDLRYHGQGLQLPVSFSAAEFEQDGLGSLAQQFDDEHTQLFTFALDAEHEIVTLRAIVQGAETFVEAGTVAQGGADPSPAKVASGTVYVDNRDQDAAVYDRAKLKAGNRIEGPAVVTEMDSTTVILPGHVGVVDGYGNIIINPDRSLIRGRSDMPVTIVQTNDAPFEPVEMDPITLDIIESALRSARYEMDAVLYRTAMSPGIREQHDEFPMIANPDGKMVVGQFGSFIHGFKREYDGTIEEGDLFLTSDPYSCAGAISHAPDWLILRPVYRDGRLIAYASMFGHMTDVGGKVPGSLPTDANQIYEEGVVIPVVKIYKEDELQEDVLKVILHQCRMPQWNRSDFNALVAAVRLAEKRLHELCDRFGVDTLIAAMDELLERNRRAMLHLIRNTVGEDETLYFEDYICDDGLGMGPYTMACKMWREGDVLVFDFEGTDPQSESSINFLLNEEMFKMFVGVYMINVFDPQIMFNDGFYDHVDVKIPPGTLLKPLKPAALSSRTHALGRIFDVLGGLLGQRAPNLMVGGRLLGQPALHVFRLFERGRVVPALPDRFWGIPGRPAGDGPDGHSLWPSFTNVPNEFLEAYFPLRIEVYETIPDSGGPGLHRGGNGVTIGYRALEPGEMSLHDDRWLTYPWGVNGGQPGGRSRKELHRTDGSFEVLPSKCDHVKVEKGDLLLFKTWGGGGWGDPYERDPALVALEVERGLVTRTGAERYGVVLRDDLMVDEEATDALREKLRAARGEVKLFDRGGTVEELRERCLEENRARAAPSRPSSTAGYCASCRSVRPRPRPARRPSRAPATP